MQIELCHFIIVKWQAGNLHWSFPVIFHFVCSQYTKQWHLALAGLTIAIIPVILSYFFAQKHIIKGVADGAVK